MSWLAATGMIVIVMATGQILEDAYYNYKFSRPEFIKGRKLVEAINDRDELLIKHFMDNRETVINGMSFFESSTNCDAHFERDGAVPLKFSIYDHLIINNYMTPGEILQGVLSETCFHNTKLKDDVIQYLLDKGAKVDKEAWTRMPSDSKGRKLLLEAYENQNKTPKFPSK